MSIVLDGTGTISGVVAGGLPDATITQAEIASGVAGTGPTFSASKTGSNQSITSSTFTKVTFNTENFDTNSNFASSTFTPTVAGYYQINTALGLFATSGTRFIVSIHKNGAEYARGVDLPFSSSAGVTSCASAIVYCNGTTDFVESYAFVIGTSPNVLFGIASYFDGALVRAA